MSDEVGVHSVQAIRQGRGRRPCEIRVGISDDGQVVLRTVDESGVSPLVALLQPAEATELCEGLLRAAHALRHAQAPSNVRARKSRTAAG